MIPQSQSARPASDRDAYRDADIRRILDNVRTIAIVGASPNTSRPSYFVLKYLTEKGYRVFPVNPGHAGCEILGTRFYASLAEIAEPVDMVDIFRSSAHAGPIVDEVLSLDPLPKVIWMQIGVRNEEAAAKAEAAGLEVVMNRCPKIEYGRLSGEIGWNGVARRTISAKRPKLQGTGFQRLSINGLGPRR